jgi:multidrug efflux pump
MLSRFFIDRPVFAWVLAIVIMLAGGIAALSLPIEQYPDIAPPAVSISAFHPAEFRHPGDRAAAHRPG